MPDGLSSGNTVPPGPVSNPGGPPSSTVGETASPVGPTPGPTPQSSSRGQTEPQNGSGGNSRTPGPIFQPDVVKKLDEIVANFKNNFKNNKLTRARAVTSLVATIPAAATGAPPVTDGASSGGAGSSGGDDAYGASSRRRKRSCAVKSSDEESDGEIEQRGRSNKKQLLFEHELLWFANDLIARAILGPELQKTAIAALRRGQTQYLHGDTRSVKMSAREEEKGGAKPSRWYTCRRVHMSTTTHSGNCARLTNSKLHPVSRDCTPLRLKSISIMKWQNPQLPILQVLVEVSAEKVL
ncbi:hypothetical protein B0H13DRAFT_2398339 [Mycena leptocephala]|nr:hypothetical protein B0H13DRAFT_2398339 [Mycena leptocephala]